MLKHLYEFYEELRREGVMFCFSGPTTQSVVEGLGQTLKRKMELESAGMSTIQRVFSIFVEQMQNIVHYSAERTVPRDGQEAREAEDVFGVGRGGYGSDEMRHGVVVVGRCDGKFYVICGNKVAADQAQELSERIEGLRGLSPEELKQHYKRMRRQDPDTASKGAGLGFIEMFRRASEPVEWHMTPVDRDTVFFSIKAIG